MSEDDTEELYLERLEISRALAEKVREFHSEVDLVRFLLNEKPAELKCGRNHYLEAKALEDTMAGLSLKLSIHGYEDRGDRLRYLNSVLQSKLSNKEEIYMILIQLLTEMSTRPTAVTHLEVGLSQYSMDPDEDIVDDEVKEREAILRRQLMLEKDHDDDINLRYSSNSDLSEWSTDEDELTEKSNNDIPIISKIRQSSSFGEFSDLPVQIIIDPEIERQKVQLHWMQERSKAEMYFHREIRKFATVALSSQPVISSLLVLQSRFGEFWEWKTYSKLKPELLIAFEEDVVREILWQFVISNPDISPVFTKAWLVKPNLMVATLSRSAFITFTNKCGKSLLKLEHLRRFASYVKEATSSKISEGEKLVPSKIFSNYASALEQLSTYITTQITTIERQLKMTYRDTKSETEPGCLTLIQLERRTRAITDMINILYRIHSKSIPSIGSVCAEPWLASIRLISCFETFLVLETRPNLYGLLLFFFGRCLHALLDDIISTLKTLKWDERYSLFVRDPCIRLNDSTFWSECIKTRNYKRQLKEFGILPLSCLEKLLPKILNILKTCEVLNQLEEDFSKVLSKSRLEATELVNEFLSDILKTVVKVNPSPIEQLSITKDTTEDFMKHFAYIGLGNSFAKDAFRFLVPAKNSQTSSVDISKTSYKLEEFINLPVVPVEAHFITLDRVLSKFFMPFLVTAKDNIRKIFQDYKVIEGMTVFQEIILAVREDFARAIIDIASDKKRSEEYKFEDKLNRNPRYQQLLNECYPEGRGSFSVDLKLDPSDEMNYSFMVTPYFPLNLIVTPQSVAGYLFIGRQLRRIRKSLWDVSSLRMKDCRSTEGVDATRLLMFRFCLINFCSSIRSFFTLKLFSKEFSDFAKSASYENDLDSLRKIHEEYLESIQTQMLRNPLIENIIIRKVVVMSELLKKRWSTGIPQPTMLTLEDTLKKCWQVVNDFESPKYSYDFNELSHHFGPPPSCLSS